MKINSSKQSMEEIFSVLAQIKTVDPKEDLYHDILEKTNQKNTVSIGWVSAVACVLVIFISTEYFMISNKNNLKNYSEMIPKTHNILYNE